MSTTRPLGRPERPGRRDEPAGTHIRTERAVYTIKEIARLLRLSLGSTYAMLRRGDLPATQRGGQWVMSKHRFEKWLDSLECRPEATEEDIAQMLDEYDDEAARNRDEDDQEDGPAW